MKTSIHLITLILFLILHDFSLLFSTQLSLYSEPGSLCLLLFVAFMAIRIDKDGSLSIDWQEWRDFFNLYPADTLDEMLRFWRQSCVSRRLCVFPVLVRWAVFFNKGITNNLQMLTCVILGSLCSNIFRSFLSSYLNNLWLLLNIVDLFFCCELLLFCTEHYFTTVLFSPCYLQSALSFFNNIDFFLNSYLFFFLLHALLSKKTLNFSFLLQ